MNITEKDCDELMAEIKQLKASDIFYKVKLSRKDVNKATGIPMGTVAQIFWKGKIPLYRYRIFKLYIEQLKTQFKIFLEVKV